MKGFCVEEKIPFDHLINSPNEKEKLIEALAATYPPDPIRHYHLQLLHLEEELKHLDERNPEKLKVPYPPELIQKVNSMFHKLLLKLGVEEQRVSLLVDSFSIKEKVSHLRHSIWYYVNYFAFIHIVSWMMIHNLCELMKSC